MQFDVQHRLILIGIGDAHADGPRLTRTDHRALLTVAHRDLEVAAAELGAIQMLVEPRWACRRIEVVELVYGIAELSVNAMPSCFSAATRRASAEGTRGEVVHFGRDLVAEVTKLAQVQAGGLDLPADGLDPVLGTAFAPCRMPKIEPAVAAVQSVSLRSSPRYTRSCRSFLPHGGRPISSMPILEGNIPTELAGIKTHGGDLHQDIAPAGQLSAIAFEHEVTASSQPMPSR